MKSKTVWTALVTPFLPTGEIDFDSFKALLQEQEKAGCGLLVLGSTGEALAQNGQDKKEVIDFVVAQSLSVPIMVGVGGFDLPEQLAWVRYCNDKVDTFLLAMPMYAKPGVKGQIAWFKALLDAAHKPCMLYNIPSRAGMDMSPEVLSAVSGHKNLWALKEASGSTEHFKAFTQANPNVAMFSGEDAMMEVLAPLGAQGLVSVAANVWPEVTLSYVAKCLQHQSADYFVWKKAIQSLFSASNPIPAKALLAHHNRITHNTVRPPLAAEDLPSLDALLHAEKQLLGQ
jgi:4-hydroxy-tetrahydrodipicolinate synthase